MYSCTSEVTLGSREPHGQHLTYYFHLKQEKISKGSNKAILEDTFIKITEGRTSDYCPLCVLLLCSEFALFIQ